MRIILVVLAGVCAFLTWDTVFNERRYVTEAQHVFNSGRIIFAANRS